MTTTTNLTSDSVIVVPSPEGMSWIEWANALISALQVTPIHSSSSQGLLPLYDTQGRLSVSASGLYAYDAAGNNVISPDSIVMQTANLADDSVTQDKIASGVVGTLASDSDIAGGSLGVSKDSWITVTDLSVTKETTAGNNILILGAVCCSASLAGSESFGVDARITRDGVQVGATLLKVGNHNTGGVGDVPIVFPIFTTAEGTGVSNDYEVDVRIVDPISGAYSGPSGFSAQGSGLVVLELLA